MDSQTISLITIPLFTGRDRLRDQLERRLDAVLPRPLRGLPASRPGAARAACCRASIQQIPGVMQGGVGWQGIIPSRAAKMGSIAVDKGIAKLGSPGDFYEQLEPETDRRAHPRDRARRHPRRRRADHGARAPAAVARPAAAGARGGPRARPGAAAGHRPRRSPTRSASNIDQLLDVKLMVIRHIEAAARARQPDLPRGRRARSCASSSTSASSSASLLGIPTGRSSPRSLPALVGAADRRRDHRLRHQLARDLDDLRAGRAAQDRAVQAPRPVPAPPARGRRASTRRSSPTTSSRSRNIGDELLHGPRSDRTRQMIETAMRPAVDRAVGPRAAGGAGGGRAPRVRRDPRVGRRRGGRVHDDPADRRGVQPPPERGGAQADRDAHARDAAATSRRCCARRCARTSGCCYLHGAVLGFGAGLLHLAIFG